MPNEEIIRYLIDAFGVAALGLIALIILRPLIAQFLENSRVFRQLEAEQHREDMRTEKELAEALRGVRVQLAQSESVNELLTKAISALPTAVQFNLEQAATKEWRENHESDLRAIGENVEQVPARVLVEVLPEWERLFNGLRQFINGLADRIIAANGTESLSGIPADLQRCVDRLDDIEQLIKGLESK